MKSKCLRAKTLKRASAVVLLSLLSTQVLPTQVLANSYYGEGDFYLGAKMGGALLDLGQHDDYGPSKDTDNPVNATTGITFGYNLNDYLAVEADMSYLGRYRAEGVNDLGEANHSEALFSIATYLSTQYHLSDEASLYFKLGPAWVNDEVSLSSGLGVRYRVSPSWQFDSGYRWIQNTPNTSDDLYEFTLGMTYKFGVKPHNHIELAVKSNVKAAVNEKPSSKFEIVGLTPKAHITLNTSELFAFDSSKLINTDSLVDFVDSLTHTNDIDNNSDLGKKRYLDKTSRIEISAHTDSIGDEGYNLNLSKQRAEAVSEVLEAELVSLGVPASILHTSWSGEASPIATNTTAKGRAQNRRVEIKLVPISKEVAPKR